MNSIPRIPTPVNEPVLSHAPGTPERAELKRTLKELSGRQLEIPLVIGGKDVHTGRTVDVVMPQDRKSTRLNSSHTVISYAVFCLKKKNTLHGIARQVETLNLLARKS